MNQRKHKISKCRKCEKLYKARESKREEDGGKEERKKKKRRVRPRKKSWVLRR